MSLESNPPQSPENLAKGKRQEISKSMEERPCIVCEKPFKPYRWWQVYCSVICRRKAFWMTHEVKETGKLDGTIL